MQSARIAVGLALTLLACAPSRDSIPETRDVRGGAPDASAPNGSDYRVVARRRHGAIGLGGAKNLSDDDAKRIVEHLADELETCATKLEANGTLVTGAARMVVAAGPKGTAEIGDTELQPGAGIAANALLCIVAPARVMPFPGAGSAKIPAILIEATWGPMARVQEGNADLPRDAGSGIGSDL